MPGREIMASEELQQRATDIQVTIASYYREQFKLLGLLIEIAKQDLAAVAAELQKPEEKPEGQPTPLVE